VAVAIAHIEGKRRRTYAGEEAWFPLLEQHGPSALRRGLIEAGVSPQVAAGLVFFLEDQLTLAPHVQHQGTRTRYRATLAALDPSTVARAIPG
jgi:hypothetical protein